MGGSQYPVFRDERASAEVQVIDENGSLPRVFCNIISVLRGAILVFAELRVNCSRLLTVDSSLPSADDATGISGRGI